MSSDATEEAFSLQMTSNSEDLDHENQNHRNEAKFDDSTSNQNEHEQDNQNNNHNDSKNQQTSIKPESQQKPNMFTYMEFEEGSKQRPEDQPPHLQPFTWRGKLRNFLHSKPFHFMVIALVLIDTGLVITEILLDLHVVEVGEESEAPEIVHYCSITILSLFMLEIGLKLLADWQHFWSHKMEIFDAVVVVIAFGFDIGVLFVENEAAAAVGLLVVLRLWRVVRIINGIILTAKNEADDRVHALKDKLKVKEDEVVKLEEKVEKQEKEITKLKDVLRENGIHVEEDPEDGDEETNQEVVVELHHPDSVFSIDT